MTSSIISISTSAFQIPKSSVLKRQKLSCSHLLQCYISSQLPTSKICRLEMAANKGINGGVKNHFIAFLGEFVGTFLFLFFAYGGTQTANQTSQKNPSIVASPDINQLLYIALIFGFSLTVNVWIFFRVSGGLFNPAVCISTLVWTSSSTVLCNIATEYQQ